jgi:tyrosine decarboxylase/aspartate 1-decarboxylase
MSNIKSDKILEKLRKYYKKDFSFSRGDILGSMCTQPLDVAKKAYMMFLETNLGDPLLFPGSKEIEKKYIDFLKELLNAPNKSEGIIGSGGTESNISAIWLAKKLNSKGLELMIPESAHFSFEKIASIMNIKLIKIPSDDNYVMDISKVRKKINDKTIAVVGIAGSTELGTIDPISELGLICLDEKVFFHVDAAFGGYIIPFLIKLGYKISDFDFKIKGVSSITIDAHKMGCSAIPLGSLIIRDNKWFDEISVETPYISSIKQPGILATRSAAPVAAAFAVAEYLGFEGYKRIVKTCMDNTIYTKERFEALGFNLVTDPVMNVLAVKLKNPTKVVDLLTKQGWKINKMDRFSAVRVVIMPHVTRKIIDKFIPAFEKTCRITGEL